MEQRVVKSVIITEFGGYESLKVIEYPLKNIDDGEVEVDVYYCGLNFADLYTRQGLMADRQVPLVLGLECSGIVSAVTNDSNHFKVGDRVICYDYNGGMYRDKIIISAKKCYKIPDDISLRDAVTIFVNYLTAYFCLHYFGKIRPGQHILISSCAGGVGWAATQLASLVKGTVICGTTSSNKTKTVHANGVHYVLSYDGVREQVLNIFPKGLDLIIDNQAGDDLHKKQEMLKSLGKIVVIGSNSIIKDEKKISIESLLKLTNSFLLSDLIMNSISVAGLHLGILTEKEPDLINETLIEIFDLLSQNKIKPKIDSMWPMEKIVDATKVLQERRNIGKVLLNLGKE